MNQESFCRDQNASTLTEGEIQMSKETDTQTAASPTIKKLAEERLKVLTTDITQAEAVLVVREDELRRDRIDIDKMKAESEEIAAFLNAS